MGDLTFDEVIAHAREGHCWICDRRGFKKLGQHLAMAHDLKSAEVRSRYGLSETQPLCTQEYAAEEAERFYRLGKETIGIGRAVHRSPRPGVRSRAQNRVAMKDVANREHVKEALRRRNGDPIALVARAAGLRNSPLVKESLAKAQAARWADKKCNHSIWEHAAMALQQDRHRMPSELTMLRYGAYQSPRHAFLADLYRRALASKGRSSSGE